MSANSRITNAYENAFCLPLNPSSKYVLFSDCHRGTGRSNDNFLKNEYLYLAALKYYFSHGFTYIEQTKQNLESDYAELDTMKISLEDQKSALALVQQAKEQELAALSTQTTQTASTKAQLEKEMQEQENEILNLVAKKQQEDAAAKKAEKEKKNQNSSSGQNSNSNSNSSSNGGNSSTPSSSGFIWPTVSKRITSPFGDTEDRSSPHKGLDIGAVSVGVAGDPIYASASGTVIIAKYSATAGNYITIDHGNGFSTVYMHCSALKVSVGDTVTQGQTIGLMGTTGNSNGVHLHFAMIKNGTYVNPQSYL